ncbi:galectin-2-like [Leucoraja erinacea]|uniref:galectin-2-like n=1 Tax=Leucoraja erinaceus TaxID=7782 RepID=UPI0024559BBE|nr:galectin-2-like [Leucoraja erinacea]
MSEKELQWNLFDLTGLQMKHGDSVEVEGRVHFRAIGFTINLGIDVWNIGLHFNPRFTAIETKIVLNNLVSDKWRAEQIEKNTLQRNEDFKVHIKFTKENFEIILCDETTMTFPNHSGLDIIEMLSIKGDLELKSVKLNK